MKKLFWINSLFVFILGCAHTQNDRAPAYSALPEREVAPTSNQSSDRVYPAPAGVAAQDWELNEKIHALFLDNRKLAPPPSEVTAVVDQQNHGVVRLSGHVSNGIVRRRVIEEVSKIPLLT